MKSTVSRSQLLSACLGNLFEHYDTALFSFLSPFLAPLFFPEQDPITALILTFAMIPLGMLARPIGSLAFGYIGDLYGREKALFISLGGMAVVSGGIALCPTFAQAGFLAPLFLGLGRVLQNFLAAGETMGGAIFVLENSEKKHHDILSGFYNSSTIAGILLASAGVSALYYFETVEGGWRLLYLIGCLTAFFGALLRRNMNLGEAPATVSPYASIKNVLKVFYENRKSLLMIVLTSGFAYANYSIALVFMNGFLPLITTFNKLQISKMNTSLLILDFLMLPFFGWLSSKISREKVMIYSALGAALTAIPFFNMMAEASFFTLLAIRTVFVVTGVAFFAPFHAWVQQIVPQAHRYLIVSFGYALGSQLLGGPTAAISLWLYQQTGMVSSAAWYWLSLGLLSGFMILKMSKQRVPEKA